VRATAQLVFVFARGVTFWHQPKPRESKRAVDVARAFEVGATARGVSSAKGWWASISIAATAPVDRA
jgi:hypothetical protein